MHEFLLIALILVESPVEKIRDGYRGALAKRVEQTRSGAVEAKLASS